MLQGWVAPEWGVSACTPVRLKGGLWARRQASWAEQRRLTGVPRWAWGIAFYSRVRGAREDPRPRSQPGCDRRITSAALQREGWARRGRATSSPGDELRPRDEREWEPPHQRMGCARWIQMPLGVVRFSLRPRRLAGPFPGGAVFRERV